MEAKFFIKGPKKSNQSSNLTSQRMVTESRSNNFITNLMICNETVTEELCKAETILLLWYTPNNKTLWHRQPKKVGVPNHFSLLVSSKSSNIDTWDTPPYLISGGV